MLGAQGLQGLLGAQGLQGLPGAWAWLGAGASAKSMPPPDTGAITPAKAAWLAVAAGAQAGKGWAKTAAGMAAKPAPTNSHRRRSIRKFFNVLLLGWRVVCPPASTV